MGVVKLGVNQKQGACHCTVSKPSSFVAFTPRLQYCTEGVLGELAGVANRCLNRMPEPGGETEPASKT